MPQKSSRVVGDYLLRAKNRLARFKRATVVSISATGILLLLGESRAETNSPVAETDSVHEAATIVQDLGNSFFALLPKLTIAVAVVAAFWFLNFLIRRYLLRSPGAKKIGPMLQIGIYTLALIVVISILAGDARALLGSLGLVGLALSWSLQTPIESFTGWMLNAFQAYYRVGDRIRVGEVFGDVYHIDYLTTTVWEAGGPGHPVSGAQPTGALITFPNNEILRSNIVNYTRDFPYVWDEVSFAVANESDLSYALQVIRAKAEEVVGGRMGDSVGTYRGLLQSQGLGYDVEDRPQVYLSFADSWTNCTVRYLVEVRSRRKWSSLLIEKITAELALPEHSPRIVSGYPKQVVHLEKNLTPQSPP